MGDTFFPFLIQSRGSRASEMQNRIFQTQETIIRRLAAEGSCILVGRCADFILADEPDAMHIYIYAAYADRLRHCMRWKDVDEDAARRLIRERDEERSAYHLNFAGYTPDDKAHKDLLISSSLLGTEGTALLLADAVRARFSRAGAEALQQIVHGEALPLLPADVQHHPSGTVKKRIRRSPVRSFRTGNFDGGFFIAAPFDKPASAGLK